MPRHPQSRQVLGFHLILTAYGFWLPNDPRGSWSDFVRAWELLRFGRATKIDDRRSVARRPHDRELRLAAKRALVRAPVEFAGIQARSIAKGFADFLDRTGRTVYACSILPTHVHMVIPRDDCAIKQVARLLKGAATSQLLRDGIHPFARQPFNDARLPTPWTRHEWACFLFSKDDLLRAIGYVERNPIKERKRPQPWKYITPFHPDLLYYT
jgi:REP element-mobilizing transposase RayT